MTTVFFITEYMYLYHEIDNRGLAAIYWGIACFGPWHRRAKEGRRSSRGAAGAAQPRRRAGVGMRQNDDHDHRSTDRRARGAAGASHVARAVARHRPAVSHRAHPRGAPEPGLLRQHLTAVQAAAAVGRARVDGDAIGSRALTFAPQGVQAGDYAFSVGTAGSATLVLQTILPPLLRAADGRS